MLLCKFLGMLAKVVIMIGIIILPIVRKLYKKKKKVNILSIFMQFVVPLKKQINSSINITYYFPFYFF